MQPKSSTPNPLTSGPEKQEVFENKELKRQFEFICPSNQMKLIPNELENNFIEDFLASVEKYICQTKRISELFA